MTRPIAVLRPEPGNSFTVRAIAAAGLQAISLPLFEVSPVGWSAPDPASYDALLITSANAIRHGGPELDKLKSLPVVAVGEASAAAARAAGFAIRDVGRGGAVSIATRAEGARLLHLSGRERTDVGADAITVYASDPIEVDPSPLIGTIALVHSARAGARLADIATDPQRIAIAAISLAAASAAGGGWGALTVAATPSDAALIDAARALID